MRIDPQALNVSLPPELFTAATTEKLPPVISATYSSKDWEDMIKARQHQFGLNLEHVNRAAMSASPRLTDDMVKKANDFVTAYAETRYKQFPVQEKQELVGAGRSTSLKMATEKKMSEE